MVATALDVLPVEDARRELSMLDDTSQDARIERLTGQAVDIVSQFNGVPLVDTKQTFELLVDGAKYADIDMPRAWPKPRSVVSYTHRTVDGESTSVAATSQRIEQNPWSNRWQVSYEAFGLTEWTVADSHTIEVTMGVDPIPDRMKSVVILVLRMLWNGNTEIPRAVADLLR